MQIMHLEHQKEDQIRMTRTQMQKTQQTQQQTWKTEQTCKKKKQKARKSQQAAAAAADVPQQQQRVIIDIIDVDEGAINNDGEDFHQAFNIIESKEEEDNMGRHNKKAQSDKKRQRR
jgi:hypothetical protein